MTGSILETLKQKKEEKETNEILHEITETAPPEPEPEPEPEKFEEQPIGVILQTLLNTGEISSKIFKFTKREGNTLHYVLNDNHFYSNSKKVYDHEKVMDDISTQILVRYGMERSDINNKDMAKIVNTGWSF